MFSGNNNWTRKKKGYFITQFTAYCCSHCIIMNYSSTPISAHLTVEPGEYKLGLATGGDDPDLDTIVVAQHQQQRHPSPAPHTLTGLGVQAGVVDVRLLEPGPGHLTLGVLVRLVQSLDLVDEPCNNS